MKQAHAAEMFSVAQSTISRWEAGIQAMEPCERAKVEAVLGARLDTAADRALAALVSESPRPIHLVCDLTHRLLAASPRRGGEFGVPVAELLGRSLWPYSTPEVMAAEAALSSNGWRDCQVPAPAEFRTGDNGSPVVPIRAGLCRWTRLMLSDGTAARLVETLEA